jgi:phage tail-like protein
MQLLSAKTKQTVDRGDKAMGFAKWSQWQPWVIVLSIGTVLGLARVSPSLWGAALAQTTPAPVIRLDCATVQLNDFTALDGIGTTSEVISHKVIDDQGREVELKVPGRLYWGEIILTRSLTSNLVLWEWRQQVIEGAIEAARQNCSLLLFDGQGSAVAQWELTNVWPAGLAWKNVSTPAGETLMMEELVLALESFERRSDGQGVEATHYLPMVTK